MRWKLFSILPGLLLARAVLATNPLYENDAVLNYIISAIPSIIPGNPPPTIDATNFVNDDWFSVSFYTYNYTPVFYEPMNTVNYTNIGTMLTDSPYSYAGLDTVGCGFQFDLQNNYGHANAGTFYNAGTIHCNSLLDPNMVPFDYVGQCLVSATNVINPGAVEVGPYGLMQFTGQSVDMSRATLYVETLLNFFTGYANISAIGTVGIDTNGDWNPVADLGSTYAYSSWSGGYYLFDTSSTAYFQFVVSNGGTNTIIRAAFVQNNSPNAPYNVYFNGANLGLGSGEVNIEWIGPYVDPATGNPATNYLYLNDNYVQGAATNNAVVGGLPENFTFTESATRLYAGTPAASGFYSVFLPNGSLTNNYAYVNAQFIPTSVPTNASASNPSGALTNLPGRIQISASRELNLALAQITQPNYMSLTSTNQFDGNTGAQIVSAYSDLYLGVTNGNLSFTNLLPQSFPVWCGTVQAWSTRWLVTVTNFIGTNFFLATNDYRVLIVGSQVTPTTTVQVQDLILYATNSVIISDALNILRTLSIYAQSLTLTTNGYGNGATSPDGELNVENNNIFWSSSLPNLRWLTNNGAIRLGNLANFGGPPPANYGAFINNGLVSDQGSTIYANNFESSGVISNGAGSFLLQSLTTTLTNGSIIAGGDVSITTGSLVTSNLVLQAGRSLTLQATNLLTDSFFLTSGFMPNTTNLNLWSVGSANGTGGNGFSLMIKPPVGDLLGTTIFMTAPPPNKQVASTWAATDYGVSTAGYTNNVAIGRLFLDGLGASSSFKFTGTGTSNAMYVDYLELRDQATNRDASGSNFTALAISPNMVIYYAQAVIDGLSVAEKMDHKNSGHLRWVPQYAGYFSSTNIVYPNGTTNGPFNAALAQSLDIDSNGNGTPNGSDPAPFFVSSEVNFTPTLTNRPPWSVRLQWTTVPLATNYIYYRTNLLSPNWLPLTNFNNYYYSANVAVTNSAHTNSFVSPQPYPSCATNVWVFDVVTNVPHFYRVMVQPWLTYPF